MKLWPADSSQLDMREAGMKHSSYLRNQLFLGFVSWMLKVTDDIEKQLTDVIHRNPLMY
jgi:hypothetical protein